MAKAIWSIKSRVIHAATRWSSLRDRSLSATQAAPANRAASVMTSITDKYTPSSFILSARNAPLIPNGTTPIPKTKIPMIRPVQPNEPKVMAAPRNHIVEIAGNPANAGLVDFVLPSAHQLKCCFLARYCGGICLGGPAGPGVISDLGLTCLTRRDE